ncbi:MAG: class II aldolase/adducin family protein [Clostridia bacterium]
MDADFIREIIACAKRLDEKGLVNAYEGNISAKHEGLIYITPTGKNKGMLTENMIAVVDEAGNQIGGNSKPTSELPMHTQIYLIREDIGGVVHAHPPFLTAHALCNKPVTTHAYPEMMGNFGRFDVVPYGRPGTNDILRGACEILEKQDVVLLANHGAIAVGKTVADAMNRIEAAEAIAKTLFLADRMGGTVDLSTEECAFFFSLSDR